MEDMQVVDAIFLFHFHKKTSVQTKVWNFENYRWNIVYISCIDQGQYDITIEISNEQFSLFFFRKYRRYFDIYYGFL